MELLKTLLFVYAAILLMSAAFSALSFFYYKDKLYRYALFLWLGTFVNAITEGVLQQSHLAMVVGLSTYFVCSLILVQILGFVSNQEFPLKRYTVAMIASLICATALAWKNAGFAWIALPVASAVAYPMLHAAYRTLKKDRTDSRRQGTNIYCGLMIANALHFLDYPFLRLNPSFSVFGFTVALILLVALSIFLPSFIIKNVSDRYSEKVSELNQKLVDYQNQMADLMSLAQVGEMSFAFVHDMASPTTLLLHYSREISALHGRGVPTEEKILSYSKGIENATSRLLKLQRLFRAMIKNDNRGDPTSVDLRESVQSCVDLFRPFLDRHSIQISVKLPGHAVNAVLLPGAVERAVLNLFQNAVNALMDHSTRTLEIALEETDTFRTISIQDSGPGIPKERLESLWERFGHSGTAKEASRGNGASKTGGSGFGLYKVKQLVDSVQGKVDVTTSSQGTTFRITLPATSASPTLKTEKSRVA